MKNTKDITLLGIMTAVIIIMLVVPGLGFIPIGLIKATIVHIPVIILAIVKGPKLGGILGAIFGVASILDKILRPTITSFIFINPIISVLPRILIGVVTGYLALYLRRKNMNDYIKMAIPAAVGSLTNTIGVLSLIYILYGQAYLEAIGKLGQSAALVIGYTALTNGLVEMLVSIGIASPISKVLIKLDKRG